MPGHKRLRGISTREERQYEGIKEEAGASGRNGKCAKEVSSRTPMTKHSGEGHGTDARAMSGTPAIYCLTCQVLRVIKNWHEQGEALVIELEPCGHVVRRSARLEWRVRKAAA